MNRPPKKKPNTIAFNWAKTKYDNPDWFVAWGEGSSSSDARLVMAELGKLCDELVKRGYDPNSVRFSVKKLAPAQFST